MSATLMIKKSTRVTRQQLQGIPAPLATPTHRPLMHAELVDMIEDQLNRAGLFITREDFAVGNQGMKLFGTLDLRNGGASVGEGTSLALGLRHGNDKSMALKMVSGARVTICDNMAMIGDQAVFRALHKHGVIAILREKLARYFGEYDKQIATVKDRIEGWASWGLHEIEAKATIYDAVTTGVIPTRLLDDVHVAYFKADDLGYPDCAPRTKFGLHNAFTRAFKSLNPAPAFHAQMGLTRLLG